MNSPEVTRHQVLEPSVHWLLELVEQAYYGERVTLQRINNETMLLETKDVWIGTPRPDPNCKVPKDLVKIREFYNGLSTESRYARFNSCAVKDKTIDSITSLNPGPLPKTISKVADLAIWDKSPDEPDAKVIGHGNISESLEVPGKLKDAEIACAVDDEYAGWGIGRELLTRMFELARDEDIAVILAFTQATNRTINFLLKLVGKEFAEFGDENVTREPSGPDVDWCMRLQGSFDCSECVELGSCALMAIRQKTDSKAAQERRERLKVVGLELVPESELAIAA